MSISRLALFLSFLGMLLGFSFPAQAAESSAYKIKCETKLTYFSSKLRDFLASAAIQTEQPAGLIPVVRPDFEEPENPDVLHLATFDEAIFGVVVHVEWYEQDRSKPELFVSIQTPSGRGDGTHHWHEASNPVLLSPEGLATSEVRLTAPNLRITPQEPISALYRLPDGRSQEWPVDYLESVTLQCGIFPR